MKKFIEIIEDIWDNIVWLFRYVWRGLKNLWIYKKVIWNDRNWDHYFILALLEKKLEQVEKFYKSDESWWADPDQAIEDIHKTRLVLKRLMDEDYSNPFFDRYWDMNPNRRIEDYHKESNLEHRLIKWSGERDNYMIKQDLEYFTTMLRKHIREWWD